MRKILLLVLIVAACDEEEPPTFTCACDLPAGGLIVTLAPTCPAPIGVPLIRIDSEMLESDQIRCIGDATWAYSWPDWALNGMTGTVVNDGTETPFIVDRTSCVAVTMGCTIESTRAP